MRTFKLIIEASEDGIWGRWLKGKDMVVSYGESLEELKINFIEAVNLYFESVEKETVTLADVKYEFQVDVESFFEVNDFINISKLAEHVGINKSLMRQYARGIKYPSIEQARRIEAALQKIGENLVNTKVVA